MAKPIPQTSYLFENSRIEPMSYFLYEVSIYKITKDMACMLDSRFFKSNKFLKINNEVILKKINDYYIIQYIDFLGAPIEFIRNNKLPIYTSKKKKK